MKYQFFIPAVVFAALTNAQTWSACNPRERTDCPKNKALGCTYEYSYETSPSAATDFTFGGSGQVLYKDGAAHFRIAKSFDAPTIASNFFIMYGKVDVKMIAAPGAGIVSSVVLQSDTLDEIDWEFLGGDPLQGQSNYFGKGNTTVYDRGAYHPVDIRQFHTYGVEWTENTLTWSIDGSVIRTLHKADVKYDQYPQTPMQIKLGSWAGGDAAANEPGVVKWAGGPTDFSKGPFDMIVESITITDYSNGNYYKYTDKSGSAKSIVSEGGQINAGPQNNKCGVEPAGPPILPSPPATTEPATTTEPAKPEETETKTESAKPEETETKTESAKPEETETEVEVPDVTSTTSTFPTMTAPFGNSTTITPGEGSALPTGGVETPIVEDDDEEDDSETDSPAEGDEDTVATTTTTGEFPESTTVTTTLTQTQTVTTCLAITTTNEAGQEITTSSTQTLTRTEKVTSVVTVPCETTTFSAPGGVVITTVVPGTIPASAIATPTSSVTKPTEVPSVNVPDVEVPDVEVPDVEVPDVEVPNVEVPNVEVPDVEVPNVEVPDVEVPSVDVPDVEVPSVEVPDLETPVDGNSPVVETPVEQPSRTQTYTTVTITTCSTVCAGGPTGTGSPQIPSIDNSTAPVFNGSTSAPPVTEETDVETPEPNSPTFESPIPVEFDGAASGLKLASGAIVAGVLGFLVL